MTQWINHNSLFIDIGSTKWFFYVDMKYNSLHILYKEEGKHSNEEVVNCITDTRADKSYDWEYVEFVNYDTVNKS